MSIRLNTTAGALLLLALSSAGVHAQDLKLVVDRGTGSFTLTGTGSTVVDLAAYGIGSQLGTMTSANFNGLSDTESGSGWELAGISNPNFVGELISDGNPLASTPVNDTVTFDLGTNVLDQAQAKLNVGFGLDVEDLTLTYYDTVQNVTSAGVVEYIGEKIYNNIGITVDLADGTAIIENESPFNQIIVGYLIEANTDDTLNTNLGTFNGVGGSFEPPSVLDGENLGEIDPTGVGVALNAGASINLGVVGGLFDDLEFSFILAGASEPSRPGFTKFLNATTPGDFNADGTVDGTDFLMWQRGETTPPLSQAALADWVANYGTSALVAGPLGTSSVSVPEPTALALALLGALSLTLNRRNEPIVCQIRSSIRV